VKRTFFETLDDDLRTKDSPIGLSSIRCPPKFPEKKPLWRAALGVFNKGRDSTPRYYYVVSRIAPEKGGTKNVSSSGEGKIVGWGGLERKSAPPQKGGSRHLLHHWSAETSSQGDAGRRTPNTMGGRRGEGKDLR